MVLTSKCLRTASAGVFENGSNDVEKAGVGKKNVGFGDTMLGLEFIDRDKWISVRS